MLVALMGFTTWLRSLDSGLLASASALPILAPPGLACVQYLADGEHQRDSRLGPLCSVTPLAGGQIPCRWCGLHPGGGSRHWQMPALPRPCTGLGRQVRRCRAAAPSCVRASPGLSICVCGRSTDWEGSCRLKWSLVPVHRRSQEWSPRAPGEFRCGGNTDPSPTRAPIYVLWARCLKCVNSLMCKSG